MSITRMIRPASGAAWRHALIAAAVGASAVTGVQAADPATPATPATRAMAANPTLEPAAPALRAAPAAPATPSTGESPAQAYQRQRADCLNGQTPQDRQTCLKEAGAALAAARRGQLSDATQRDAIAAERCSVHKDADDRLACERMALGEGRTDGSVAEGAVVKEMVTRTVKPLSR